MTGFHFDSTKHAYDKVAFNLYITRPALLHSQLCCAAAEYSVSQQTTCLLASLGRANLCTHLQRVRSANTAVATPEHPQMICTNHEWVRDNVCTKATCPPPFQDKAMIGEHDAV